MTRSSTLSAALLAALMTVALSSCAAPGPTQEEQCDSLKVATDKVDETIRLALTSSLSDGVSAVLSTASENIKEINEVDLGPELSEPRDEFTKSLDTALSEVRAHDTGATFKSALGDMAGAQTEINSLCGWPN